MRCRPTQDRDDGIREAECEGGEGCRLAAGRLQGGQSVRQEACRLLIASLVAHQVGRR